MSHYRDLLTDSQSAPDVWKHPCVHTELTLHQLSPYIGKLKSIIAHDLISEYSQKGDLVADVFCGSGTIPLECAVMGRRLFASDMSDYSITLTKGKLYAPRSLIEAKTILDNVLNTSRPYGIAAEPIPQWVREFYHPRTLTELLEFISLFRKNEDHFLLACILGISHHQRPGFLSYPSSHLVPYLRSKKFPKSEYPELYRYRSVGPRLRAKVDRAYRRHCKIDRQLVVGIERSAVNEVKIPDTVDCFLTSPPYMNALDYGRDNRLRNWLLTGNTQDWIDENLSKRQKFISIITSYARLINKHLVAGGHAVYVVGDSINRSGKQSPSEIVAEIMDEFATSMTLKEIVTDKIPDIRRARRNTQGVKSEHFLIYERT